jgi:ABC-2 type transport system permease protein
MGKALGIILALVAFLGGANGIAATAISREGQQLYIKRYIPVSYRKQLAAKLLSGVVIGYTSVILVLVVLTAVLKAPLYFAGIVLILSFLPLLLTSMGGLLFDLINPKLEWDSEQKAVKQNVNVFFSILFSVVIAIAVIAVSFAFDLSLAWALVVLPALLLAGCAGFYYLLSTYGVSTFKNLEG